jgi:hypothetical protein
MRRSKRMIDEYQSENFNPEERYNLAYKRVKKSKDSMFTHLFMFW